MPFSQPNQTVGGVAVQLVNPSGGSVGDPVPVVIANNDPTVTLFIGGSTVTAATGFPVYPRSGIGFRLIAGDAIFGITTGASIDVRVLIGRS